MKSIRPLLTICCALLLLTSCGGQQLTIVSYNVGAFHKPGFNTIGSCANTLASFHPDVIALQEVDSCTHRCGQQDQLRAFTDSMQFGGCHYTPAFPFDGGGYGIGLTWKKATQPKAVHSILLPKMDGSEVRALSVADFGRYVVASTHLDHISEAARLAQVDSITRWTKAHYGDTDIPVILCGDFNDTPDSPALTAVKESWQRLSPIVHTYSADEPSATIDYIFIYKNGAESRVHATAKPYEIDHPENISDHLPLIVQIDIR